MSIPAADIRTYRGADALGRRNSATVTKTDGSGTSSATTSFQYTADAGRYPANGAAVWGKIRQIDGPDGSWERFEYDPQTGWLTADITPFQNSGPGDGNTASCVTAYESGRISLTRTPHKGTTVVR